MVSSIETDDLPQHELSDGRLLVVMPALNEEATVGEVVRGVPLKCGTRCVHVRKDHRRTTEDIVFEHDTLVDGNVVLYLHVVTDFSSRTDDDVLPDATSLSDTRSGQDVTKVPDEGSLTDLDTVVNVRRFMDREAS